MVQRPTVVTIDSSAFTCPNNPVWKIGLKTAFMLVASMLFSLVLRHCKSTFLFMFILLTVQSPWACLIACINPDRITLGMFDCLHQPRVAESFWACLVASTPHPLPRPTSPSTAAMATLFSSSVKAVSMVTLFFLR